MAIGQEKTKIIKVCINIEYKKYIVRTVNRYTSKCMHCMNQTEAEYFRHGKRSQKSKFEPNRPSSIGGIARYLLRMRTIGHVT